MYALIQEGRIVSYGSLPHKIHTNGRWYNLRPPEPEIVAEAGFVEVVEVPRPEDTETVIHDNWDVELVEGVPTMVWRSRTLSQEEIQAEQDAIEAQIQEEKKQAVLEATVALMETAHEDGNAWVQPTGAHDAYKKDAHVTHDGKDWVSLIHANVWEPGVSGWREQVSEGYPAWVQPTGGHDAYNIGDRVSFEGSNYESTINGNVWSPTGYPAGWTLIP